MKKIKRADIERILILCAAALVVVLALKGDEQGVSQVLVEQTSIPIEQTAAQPAAETVSTVVYYEDGEGYLVPVTRQIEKTDGIAKATLGLMVKESANDMQAARLGLRTVIPEGTTFEIDIANGRANVNVSKEALTCSSAAEEALMVDAIVHTMAGFASVEEVTLEFDGQKRSKLTYGTDVSGVFTGKTLNMESVETLSSNAGLVQLYFPSQNGRMLVPVSRTVYSDADVSTAVLELAKGPKQDSGLERALPPDCGIKRVNIKNGVVSIDFSREFTEALQATDGGERTIRAILFTCSQFPGVKKVEVLVEGQKIEKQPNAQATFINEEAEVLAQYPGVVELD